MNFYSLNSATLNGGIVRAIAGAALVSAVVTASAESNVKIAGASQLPVTVTYQVDGQRRVPGAASGTIQSSGNSESLFLITTSVDYPIVSKMRAANTDAYAGCAATITASGTKLQGGATNQAINIGLTALPKVEVNFTSNITPIVRIAADPSVKLSGQAGFIHDGYPASIGLRPAISVAGDRIANSSAQAITLTDCAATAQWIQGGAAAIPINFTLSAVASSDSAFAVVKSSVNATPTATLMTGGAATVTVSISAEATNTKLGGVVPIAIKPQITVQERYAVQAGSAISISTAIKAEYRMALQGQAAIVNTYSLYTAPEVWRYSGAEYRSAAVATALWSIIRQSSALGAISSQADADPTTNPTAPAPIDRTMLVARELRAMRVPEDNRTMKVL